MNDLLNVGNLYKEGFVQTDLIRIKPLFLIKYTIKEKQKSIHKTKSAFSILPKNLLFVLGSK